jgi:hypothetical protein
MSLDYREVVQKIDSHLAVHPNASLQIIAGKLGIAVQDLEKALREIEGVSFSEFKANKRLAQAFRQLGEVSPAANGPYEINRARRRLTIPKATVQYQAHRLWLRKTGYSDQCPLVDLSREGLAFLADQVLKSGKQISLLLRIPGESEIPPLTGHIVYAVATGIAGYRYRIGIQFLPFAERRGCNSLKILEILVKVEKTYAP